MTDLTTLVDDAAMLVRLCTERGVTIATAESCTGGLISGLITEVPGSSLVLERGFVTYSNAAKSAMLGVPADLIASVGAVSREVAIAMAEGALVHSPATISVAVTGIAGPGGGSSEKPVGLVHLCALHRRGVPHPVERRFGDIGRSQVRLATVRQALGLLREMAEAQP